MTWRRALPWLLLFAALAGWGGASLVDGLGGDGRSGEAGSDAGAGTPRPGATLDAVVTRVVDGDTVKVRLASGGEDTVRYIGMDTPETKKPGSPVECFGKAASARNAALVDGRRVTLEIDAEPRDRYGRLLAYVRRRPDGLFVNAALVREGFATTLTIPPDVRHAGLFRRLQRAARETGRGLWRACGSG